MAFEWTTEDGRWRLRLDDDGVLWKWDARYPEPTGIDVAEDEDAYGGLSLAVAALEVYRKALEPFLRRFKTLHYVGAHEVWVEIGVAIPSEHHAAMLEACRLMGIPSESEP